MLARGAVIIPYRDREDHLKVFIPHFRKYTQDKFYIYIIEQVDGKPFNRAKLLNIGVSMSYTHSEYFIFHDVDMLPTHAYYDYPFFPTHIATRCSQFNYRMPDPNYFGGVTLVNKKHFIQVNGFSNDFWGYGYEDEEFRERFAKKRIRIARKQCIFESLPHERPVEWKKHLELKNSKQPLPPEFIQYEKNKSLHKNPDMTKGFSTVHYNIIHSEDKGIIKRYIVDI